MSINMGPFKGGKLDCELNDVTGENEFVSALENKADYIHLAIEVRRLIPNLYFKEILYQGMLKFWVKTLLESESLVAFHRFSKNMHRQQEDKVNYHKPKNHNF